MTLLVPRAPFEHAEQRTFSEDRATILAAVEDLARDFTIKASGDGTWELGARKPDVHGTLELGTDDGRTTLVLRVAPNLRIYTLRQLQVAYYIAAVALWLGLGLFLWLGKLAEFFAAFGVTAIIGVILADVIKSRLSRRLGPAGRLLPAATVIASLERWSSRPGSRWIARWHARFWPALTARLTRAQPYR